MNQYTLEFHSARFPGYQPSQAWQWDSETFWYRQDIPWIELPWKFDTQSSADFLHHNHHELFGEIAEQQNQRLHNTNTGRDWFASEHQCGWQQCAILRGFYPALDTQLAGTDMPAQRVQPTLHPDVCQDVIAQIQAMGVHLHWCDVKSLAVHGWIQPHRDPKVPGTTTMEYFWLPLNACSPNLKVWPAGYVQAECGRMYLVNNQNWLHSVVNHDPWTRYVLLGRIDRRSLSHTLLQDICDSAREQWFEKS